MYYNVSGLIKEKIGSNREWSIEPINLNYDDRFSKNSIREF